MTTSPQKIFTAGTLRYTKGALWILFSWLLWNDLCLMLMENVAPQLVPLMLKDHGASNREIALFTSTLSGAFTIWINPFVSTWSDQYRSKAGRRRPFLFFATPFCALFLAAIPFMPDLFKVGMGIPAFAHLFAEHSSFGIILFIGLCYLFYQIFNSVILALFSYYFYDVVPNEVMGRFSALTKVASTLAVFVWNYYLFGFSEKHLKEVFVGVAAFFLIMYFNSIWQVKEGEYPPPESRARMNFFQTIGSYFSVCFSKPYFLWYFASTIVFQIGNASNAFQIFYFRDQLHLDLDTIGKMKSIPTLLVVFIGYPMGALIDRLKPGLVLASSIALYGVLNVFAFFFLNDKWSMLLFMGLISIVVCSLGISMTVFQVGFFPREKLGQFCSANALSHNIMSGLVASFVVGIFFDWIKDYRYAFLWSAAWQFPASLLFLKVYFNWKRFKKECNEPAIS